MLSYVPRVDAVVTGNPGIARIFRDYGLKVLRPPYFNREMWRGEKIRALMASGDPAWREAVTPSTAQYLESIGGPERVRDLYSTD
ncbi:nicotinamide-nucleotide adenylyltransferase [compost metagenome]